MVDDFRKQHSEKYIANSLFIFCGILLYKFADISVFILMRFFQQKRTEMILNLVAWARAGNRALIDSSRNAVLGINSLITKFFINELKSFCELTY